MIALPFDNKHIHEALLIAVIRLLICKLFTFLSSREQTGQFQPNLAQSIVG